MAWFKLDVCCFALLLVVSCSVVFANRRSSVNLAFECISIYPPISNKAPVIFLHGLTDTKETWEGIYEGIPFATNRRVCIYDARNHGDSSWNDTFSIDVLAEDLGNFMSDREINKASLVGHSLGGLTIMKFALKNPDKVESIFVEDISPTIRKEITETIRMTLKVLKSSLSVIPDDADEETALKAVLEYFIKVTNYSLPEEQPFKKSPLRCKDGVWEFISNFDVFIKALEDADSFVGKMEGLYDGRSFFIYGEESEFKVLKLDMCCFTLLLVISCSVVLANSESSIHLAYKCTFAYPTIPDKLPVIFLHGLTDVKETWDGIWESIPNATNRSVCIYDARNHGDSSWSDTFNVDVLAQDLGNFMCHRGIPRASLVGHSLGGLTVMKFALRNPEKVESVFVEDVSPTNFPKEIADIIKFGLNVLRDGLAAVPADADEETALQAVIDYFTNMTNFPPPEHHFKKSPIVYKDGKWQWKANFDGIINSLHDVDKFIGEMEGRYNGRSFFMYGEQSEFKVWEHKESILELFPKAEFFGVEGAGHGVHTHREIYINKLVEFLNSQHCV